MKYPTNYLNIYKIMLAISHLPSQRQKSLEQPSKDDSLLHERYEGDITANPLQKPVLTLGYPENAGHLKDEQVSMMVVISSMKDRFKRNWVSSRRRVIFPWSFRRCQ